MAELCAAAFGESQLCGATFGNATDAASYVTPALAPPLAHVLSQHRMAVTAGVVVGINLVWVIARYIVARAESKHRLLLWLRAAPLLHLDTQPPGLDKIDLAAMVLGYVAIGNFYKSIIVPEGRVYAEGEEELFVIRYRLELFCAAFLVCVGVYHAAHRALRDKVRNPYMLDMQAANSVRVLVKCSWYVILPVIGNWWHITFSPVSELRESDFANTWLGVWWMNVLYIWEVIYREQTPESVPHAAPTMFVHHAAACFACWSSMEWFGNDTGNMALRKLAPCGVVMSFTEGWCSLVVLLGSFHGCSLRQWSRVMLIMSIVCAIVYNMIAVWWAGTIWFNWDELPEFHRTVSAPLVLALTYPAQCAMINMFYGISRRLARQADEQEAKTGKSSGKSACPVVLP